MDSSEDYDHAALVDSFFLPGGILDPYDEEEVPKVTPFTEAKVSRVPSNPWRNDCKNGTSDETNGLEERGTKSVPQHLKSANERVDGLALVPPPGYTENDRIINNNHSFFHITPTGMNSDREIERNIFNLVDERHNGANSFHVALGNDDKNVPGLMPSFPNKEIQRQKASIEIGKPKNNMDKTTGLPQAKSIEQLARPEESNEIPSSKLEESIVTAAASTDISGSIILDINDAKEGCGDNDGGSDEGEDATEESLPTSSDPSIPEELLSVQRGSLASSMSNSSRHGDELEPSSSHIDSQEKEFENIDAKANQSLVPNLVKNSALVNQSPNDSRFETPDTVCTAGGSTDFTMQKFRVALTAWSLFVAELPNKGLTATKATIMTWIQKTSFYHCMKRTLDLLSLQTTKILNTYRIFSQWLDDAIDIVTALSTQLLCTISLAFTTFSKVVIIGTSFLNQVWKYSLFEAVEESNVTICYLVFYFMPAFCSLLMDLLNIPHWTPHLLTSLTVFSLCNQVKAGHLQMEDASLTKLVSTKTSGPLARQDERIPRDEQACKTILRILRFVLPIFFLADGFSSEFGTIMGVSGASRLTTAFMMSLVRKNLVSSPIGWVSWALQVLIATYYQSWRFLDQLVLVVGLSSLRLVRFLEEKRLTEKKRSLKRN